MIARPGAVSVREASAEKPSGPAIEASPGLLLAESSPCRRDRKAALLLGFVSLLVFNLNFRSISPGDAYPARYLPLEIWRDGSLFLDRIAEMTEQGRSKNAFWIVEGRGGHAISLYPIVLPVLVAPLYLPAVGYLSAVGWTDQRMERTARIMEKVTASILAAASTAMLYLLLLRRTRSRTSLLLTLAFAFGTTTWVISSQALWQHGLGELLVVGTLLLVTGPCTTARMILAGVVCGLIACNRPPDAILAAAFSVYALWWAGRLKSIFIAAALIPICTVLMYNFWVAGNVAGGYGLRGNASFFEHALLPGLAGLLFSPARGLFVFSPFLLCIPFTFKRVLKAPATLGLTVALTLAIALQVLLYAKSDWRAGATFGPRYLTDLLPILFWMLPPIVEAMTRVGRGIFVLACGAAIAIQAIGAFWYTGASNEAIFASVSPGEEMSAAWDVRNTPFIAELRHEPAAMDLGVEVAGFLDSISLHGSDVREVAAGEDLAVEGWALIGGASPQIVTVSWDGEPAGSTSSFYERPDVVRSLGRTSPAGWRVPIETSHLAPGEHTLSVVAGNANADLHFVAERRLTILENVESASPEPQDESRRAAAETAASGDLSTASGRAAAILKERQEAAGYWLTSYTSEARFEQPHKEMNTFLTSVMVDLLQPVAAAAGLKDSLRKARQHLGDQIESSGLVRYHGLPDAPTIGTLGCAITPDADDTTLVWRIAPGKHAGSLESALKVLDRYRTDEGLYRTWLASPDHFECIDPGKDPNPADAAIQMHVLMLLARADPAAARALCGALRRGIADDRIWVYYQMAPLVPILRQADLRKAGCPMRLPAARLRTSVPGQESWVAAGLLLERFLEEGSSKPSSIETVDLLRALSADDFSLLRRSPPLIYHNDLTASVKRFYWSEEFGYALWLRIYLENARKR